MSNDDAAAIRRLLDIEEIKQLKARYFRFVDAKDWDAWAQVFAVDAVLEIPEGELVHRGRDEIVANVSAVMEPVRTVHHGHMPEIELIGPDTARAIWAMEDYVEFPPAEDGTRMGLRGYGHYHEEYRRDEGTWRIARLHLARLRVDLL
jgi:uncharacterized protein (TIGR02246 family)